MRFLIRILSIFVTLFLIFPFPAVAKYPIEFQDAAGRTIFIDQPFQKVVSIVPAVTEILFRIGAGDDVAGVTYHDKYPPQAATKPTVGGFFLPSIAMIDALAPDALFVSEFHETIITTYTKKDRAHVIQLPLNTLADLYASIALLGKIFQREQAAKALMNEIKVDLEQTNKKINAVPAADRKRVMRLMGRNRVMTPGDDSFQTEMIRLAGGIAPKLGKTGAIVPMTLEEWKAFNPEVIYGCGQDRQAAEKMLDKPGWRDVDAVKNSKIFYFPCELTCRLSTRTGYFVSCLAATIYGAEFATLPRLQPDRKIGSKPVSLVLDYVGNAEVVESRVNDYTHKTLLIHLNTPMSVNSTLEGYREQIRVVGNSYSPPQVWGLYHRIGLEESRRQLMQSIDIDGNDTSLLFTGANMDNLSVQKQQFKEMVVYALVTAGVRSNAVRMAEDIGRFYEPGTINMIILSNMQLTPRAMNRAIISATEAKSAALQDMDIRSAYTAMANPATGTGTDNIIVVEGTGTRIDNTGGHSKMGELIAKAVYAGVKDAVYRQNGLIQQRSVFHRLEERKISLFGLVGDCSCGIQGSDLTREMGQLLLEPATAGFVEAALAISDQYERGLITDISYFEVWCDQISTRIAGKPISGKQVFDFSKPMPHVLKIAFEALLNGISARIQTGEKIQ